MPISRPRPLRSTTLLSGVSSFSKSYARRLCLRRSLTGHWTLIEPESRKPLYYLSPDSEGSSLRELRLSSFDGPLLAIVDHRSSPFHCHLSFANGKQHVELKLSFRGRHQFNVDGRKLYWKRDRVCRESRTGVVLARTNEETLLIYQGAEPFLDVIVASFLAVKAKRLRTESRICSWLKVITS